MSTKVTKSRKVKQVTPKRLTFTFSNTPQLNFVVQKLEKRFGGLNRAEIIKLALIELNNFLEIQDKLYEKIVSLSDNEENSLTKAMKSESVLVDTTKKGELEKFLKKAKKEVNSGLVG